MTTLTFTRGVKFPVAQPLAFAQRKAESEGGLVRVATVRPPRRFLTLVFTNLMTPDHDALEAWLTDPLINGSAFPFTYTDAAETDYTVRWWGDTYAAPQVASGVHTWEGLLRVQT